MVAISAGWYHSLALKADGTVVAWGNNFYGQTDVPVELTGVVAISDSDIHSLALKADGTVVAWGYNNSGQMDAPDGLTGVVAISAGGEHNLALVAQEFTPRLRAHPLWEAVDGWYWPLGADLHLTIEDPNTIKSPDLEMWKSVDVVTGPPDYDSVWFEFKGVYDLKPGDIVTLTDGTTTQNLEVSVLTIISVDNEADIVTGKSEPAAIVRLPQPGEIFATADTEGNWSADFGAAGFDLERGSMIIAEVFDEDFDLTSATWYFPRPYVRITAPSTPLPVNAPATIQVNIIDPYELVPYSVSIEWGDGLTSEQTIWSRTAMASHQYSSVGIYTITVTVTDSTGVSGQGSYQDVVIYNPDGGFVTGAGWITSPPGAFILNPSVTGNATFGFVSMYRKGVSVPDGNAQFRFNAGDFHFKSTIYEWLIVNQNETNAQFKGYGTVNGEGNYGFMIWAGNGSPDTFRIQIWDVDTEIVIYDNGAQQAIGGGNIVIHK